MSFIIKNQIDNQRQVIIAQMIALEKQSQNCAPNPDTGARGITCRDSRADPNSYDSTLAELGVEGAVGGVLGATFANSWDAVEATSELYTVRTNDRYEMGVKGSLGGSFNGSSTKTRQNLAEDAYQKDLPKLRYLENAYKGLSQKLDTLEGHQNAVWQLNADKMQRSMAGGLKF